MAVTFDLPPELERDLRQEMRDLEAEAREALLIDLYRRGRLSHVGLSQVLGLDRFEVEELLQKHNVVEDLGTTADYLHDASVLEQLRRTTK